MRHLEQTDFIPHCQETRYSTHASTCNIKGVQQQFISSGRGKTHNHDYELLHYENN